MNKLLNLALIILVPLLASCHENGPYECLDWDGPVFQTDELPNAVLNQEYEAKIQVEVNNEPQDDFFIYDFEVEDDLPEGLEFYQTGDSRVLTIEGTPTETGVFIFEILVRVSGNRDICYHTAREQYVLTVDEI